MLQIIRFSFQNSQKVTKSKRNLSFHAWTFETHSKKEEEKNSLKSYLEEIIQKTEFFKVKEQQRDGLLASRKTAKVKG